MITTVAGTNVAQTLAEVAETNATPEDNAGDLTASGTLAFDDVEAGDTFTARIVGLEANIPPGQLAPTQPTLLGMLTLGQTAVTEAGGIPWSFRGGENHFDYLGTGDKLLLTYTIEVKDNGGGVDTQTVTITIEGRTDNATGTEGNDELGGDRGDNTILGFAGDDALAGGRGNDSLNGGDGIDEARYGSSLGRVIVNLDAGTALDGLGGVDELISIEAVRGSDFDDILIGGEGDNRFAPGKGNDTIEGGGPEGEAFNVIDELRYDQGPAPDRGIVVTFAGATSGPFAGATSSTVQDAWLGTDTFTGIEAVRGTNLNDFFYGGTGSQRFRGLGGADYFDGGAGVDEVDYRRDVRDEAGLRGRRRQSIRSGRRGPGPGWHLHGHLAGRAWIRARRRRYSARTARDGFGTTDTFFEQSIERIRGTDQRDVIIGNSLDNELRGEGGDDLIRAGGGNDELVGGAGADNLQGGDGFDEVDYLRDANFEGGNQGVIVNLSGGDNPFGIAIAANRAKDGFGNTDTLTSIENVRGTDQNDIIVGNGVANLLRGEGGNDVIGAGGGADIVDGGAGADILRGGGGLDQLTGGFGNDTFVFGSPADGSDTITDFTEGDLIEIEAAGFGLAPGASVNFVSATSLAEAGTAPTGSFIHVTGGTDAGTVYWDSTGSVPGAPNGDAVALFRLAGIPDPAGFGFRPRLTPSTGGRGR